MENLRSYVSHVLLEFVKTPFKMSPDYNWGEGQFIFYFDRPTKPEEVYGEERGNIHGELSHAIKHASEFMMKEEKNAFWQRIRDDLKASGIEEVWQGKKKHQMKDLYLPEDQWDNPRNIGIKKISVDRLTRRHIFNALDWITDKKILKMPISSQEEILYKYAKELHAAYSKKMAMFSMERYSAIDVSDSNFASKADLFEKLKDLYMNSEEIIFDIARRDGEYRVTYNLATFLYTSIRKGSQQRGTFFRMEKKRRYRTLRGALVIWGRQKTSDITDKYSYLRELCEEANIKGALPHWQEWGINYRYDKKGLPTGAPIPHKEDINEVRKYIRKILKEESIDAAFEALLEPSETTSDSWNYQTSQFPNRPDRETRKKTTKRFYK